MAELNEEKVTKLLKTSRGRETQYLCRAFLQFGQESMSKSDLDKLRKLVGDE